MSGSDLKLDHSSAEVHKIKKVQFGILSEQEVISSSVVEVNSTVLYNKDTGHPAENGLNDPRMGVTTRGILCQSCFGEIKQCPGHPGHIKLAEPVYHIGFINQVLKVLKCVCYCCSSLLLTQKKLAVIMNIKNPKARLREIMKCASKECYEADPDNQDSGKIARGCGKKQPKYIKRGNEILIKKDANQLNEDDVDTKRPLRATEAYDILHRINDDTIKLLGMNPVYSRPDTMIIKALVVAPPQVRPSIELESSAKSEDDLTHMYQTILSTNMELENARARGHPLTKIEEITTRLQNFVGYLMNNESGKAKHKSGRPIKSIRQRLKGKEGRLRGNLMGKRVDYSARTVVSPDPTLELDELGVPLSIAMELTYPEVVTQLNIEFLKNLVERGDEWPGARYYKSKVNDKVVDLNFVATKPNLQYGDIVERHLMDGDYVLFNRQPSLHKMSIMGHRVRVLHYSTFRLNLSVVTPYNADFDGDEMNMHVPQNLEAKAEIMKIMHVPKQIVTPQGNRPIMGLVQDVLNGIRLFTLRDTFIEEADLYNILMWIDNWDGEIPKPAILKPRPLWTGKQIISMIIPEINYMVFDSEKDDPKKFHANDRNVIIKRGELLVGTLAKRHVGHVRGSIVGCLWLDYGPDATKNFLSYAQRMINNWLLIRGFSVGIEDTVIEEDVFRDIKKKVEETQKEFALTLQDTQIAQHKLIKHQPGKTILESFEVKVNGLLNDCGNQIGSLLNKNIRSDNNFNIMIESGSKGSNLNIRQICGLVGQVNVEGKRIPYGFKNRTLPHFMKDDLCPESKGFVSQSYFTGLSPEEFFFHTMGGREGLIDTAVKTSQTGYMQRRLVKAMEDVMVQYDSTVRDSYGAVVQFLYGEDGMAGEYIEEQKFDLADRSDEFIAKSCSFYEIDKGKADLGFIEQIQKLYEEEKITTAVRESLIENTNSHKILHEEYNQILSMRENMRELYLPDPKKASKHLPVNIERLITQAQFNISEKGRSDLNPIDVYSEVKKLTESLVIVPGSCDISHNANGNALKLFRYFVHYKLTSRKVILDYKLSSDAFRYLLNEIRERYQIAQVHPGEMVGSIGAQSLSETLTQMTLNTFHFAGVSDMNITLGVPRIQEIINCAKNIKDPSMTIHMKEEYRYNKEAAVKLMNLLEFTTVRDLAKCSEIYYDPDPNQTIIQADEDLVWGDPGDDSRQNWSPWLLRIEMEPAFLYRKDVKLDDIVRAIEKFFPPNSDRALDITTSLYTADLIVLRLRMKKRESDPEGSSNQYHDLKKIEKFILEDMAIKGLCPKVAYKQQKLNIYTQNGIEDENKASGGEFVLETRGSNLNKAFEFEAVDAYRTTTNHTMDIYEVLGIEAARNSILQEITLVLNFFGIYVNRRHINLLADVITASGKLMSISRNGINRVYHSALRKCSFEETVEILMEASANAELDDIKGVTENVMMGQLSKLGTGCFDVLMDKAYFFGENEADKNAIAEKWKYFPDQNPYNPVEEGMADDEQGGGIDTPHPQKTPGPGTDWMRTKTPNINAEFEHGNVFAQSPGIFTPTAMTPGYQSRGMTPRQPSPHSIIYSPYADKNFRNHGDPQTQVMSPMLPNNTQPMSPSMSSNLNSAQGLAHSGSELKYSPLSPHYNNSPMRGYSPSSNRHYSNGMSPSYSYNSPSSPNYSPNSSGSPSLSGPNSGSSLHTPHDAYSSFKQSYNPESPAYHISAKLVRRKDEQYSDEESGDDDAAGN